MTPWDDVYQISILSSGLGSLLVTLYLSRRRCDLPVFQMLEGYTTPRLITLVVSFLNPLTCDLITGGVACQAPCARVPSRCDGFVGHYSNTDDLYFLDFSVNSILFCCRASRAALSSDIRWCPVDALLSQGATCSGHSCPVLCRADKRHSNLLVLVLLHLLLLELSSQSLYTERRARPGFVQCVTLALHVDTRSILGITGTRHVELPY